MGDILDDSDMGRRTFWVDRNKVERISEMGLDVSALVNATLDLALSEEFEDLAVQGKLRKINADQSEITAELGRLEIRKTLLLNQQIDLQTTQNEIISSWEQTKDRVHKSRYIRSLNQIIIINNYDLPTVQMVAGDIIESITRLEPDFQLVPHMAGLKKMMRH